MARSVRASGFVSLEPTGALALWRDPERWGSFVEGFGSITDRQGEWPQEGAKVVWRSVRGGRGTVTEKVVENGADSFATRVFEQRLIGTQRASFEADGDGTRITLELEYDLVSEAPLSVLADVFFVRRTVREMLMRTLRRFGTEADEDAGLR